RSTPGQHSDHRRGGEEARRSARASDHHRRSPCEHVGGFNPARARSRGARRSPPGRAARDAAWRRRRLHLGLRLSQLGPAMAAIAFVFPGQGSQSVGMMAGFEGHPLVRATFDEASTALGDDLWAIVNDGPEEALNRTVNTQPVMLTAGVAVW